jgi:hypothetical protein
VWRLAGSKARSRSPSRAARPPSSPTSLSPAPIVRAHHRRPNFLAPGSWLLAPARSRGRPYAGKYPGSRSLLIHPKRPCGARAAELEAPNTKRAQALLERSTAIPQRPQSLRLNPSLATPHLLLLSFNRRPAGPCNIIRDEPRSC